MNDSARQIAIGFRRTHFLNIALAASAGLDVREACQLAEDALAELIERERDRLAALKGSGNG